jgi:hypothetical protein
MIKGSCHCGAAHWQFDGVPDGATACNCTVCRRYGTLWAYGFEGETVAVSGPTQAYVRGKALRRTLRRALLVLTRAGSGRLVPDSLGTHQGAKR